MQGFRTRGWPLLGQWLVALLLVLLALLAMAWQAADWVAPDPGLARIAWSVAAVACFLLLPGWPWVRHLRGQRGSSNLQATHDGQGLVVVYASQTGTAEGLATQTVASLRDGGLSAEMLPIGKLDIARLQQLDRVLFVVSTTGEGDAPDMAFDFVSSVMHGDVAADHLQYGVLALGDSAYRNFCGFGKNLERWLHQAGAHALFDTVEVDNGDAGALRHWQYHLGQLCGRGDLPDWQEPEYAPWRLQDRHVMNVGSAGGPCFEVVLRPEGALPEWQAGDVAEIGPQNAPGDVLAWLKKHDLGGETLLEVDGSRECLVDRLARSVLPADGAGGDLQAMVKNLVRLPHRDYSIASLPSDGEIKLLLRQWRFADGRLGIGTGWLTEYAQLGDSIALRVRANANFHAPFRNVPMLLIGNGTGVAGLRGLLAQRIAAGHLRNWLIFGERNQQHDFFYRDEVLAWQQQGAIERLDLAFSRDQPQPRYVQHCLDEAADFLRPWVAAGGVIFVCGSLSGMAPGVDESLRKILGDAAVQSLIADGRYRRDVY